METVNSMKQKLISEEQLNYVTRGVVTDATLRAFTEAYWRKSAFLKLMAALIAILVVTGAWFLTHGEWFELIVNLLLIAGMIAALQVSRKRAVRVYEQEHSDPQYEEEAPYMTGYTDTFVYTENQRKFLYAEVAYEDIRCLYETEQYLFLLTKDAKIIETFLECLSKEEEQELLAFLKQKGVKKKW